MEEIKTEKNIAEEELEKVSAGDSWDAGVYKRRYMSSTTPTEKAENAKKYMLALGYKVEFGNPKYPCPVCGSRNVGNADPGIFRYMRVICYDCGAFRDRDGDDPWGLGESDY